MSWTDVSDTTDPGWGDKSDTTNPSWEAGSTETARVWKQLSKYTLNDPDGGVDFILRADEQYPIFTYEHHYVLTIESGYTNP